MGRSRDVSLRDESVDGRVDDVACAVCRVQRCSQRRRKTDRAAIGVGRKPIELHPFPCELPEINVPAAVAARDIAVRVISHAFPQRMFFHWEIVVIYFRKPRHDVVAAIEPGAARCVTNREMNLTSSKMQIFGDLRA